MSTGDEEHASVAGETGELSPASQHHRGQRRRRGRHQRTPPQHTSNKALCPAQHRAQAPHAILLAGRSSSLL